MAVNLPNLPIFPPPHNCTIQYILYNTGHALYIQLLEKSVKVIMTQTDNDTDNDKHDRL